MSQDIYPKRPNNGKALVGLILLAFGCMLLLRELDFFFFPHWLFSFPVIVIVFGLYIGARHNFRNAGWLVLVLIGCVMLGNQIEPGLSHLIWPMAIIAFGVWLIVRRNYKWEYNYRYSGKKKPWDWDARTLDDPAAEQTSVDEKADPEPGYKTEYQPDFKTGFKQRTYSDDFLDVTSVFGNVKKIVLSKDFKGGDIVNVFGGADLNFTQADINGRVIIDVTQFFGGIKLIVPPHWHVVSNVASVFAGIEDKRKSGFGQINPDNNKTLVLVGTSVFAGIEIKSY